MGTDVASTIADGFTLEGEGPRRAIVVYHRDGLSVVPLLPGAPIVIGRTAPSDITPRSRRLSRRHARFEWIDGAVWVEDLDSTNGTFVNSQRIHERTRLRLGDEATLGSVTVTLHGLDDPWLKPLGLDGHERFQGLVEAELQRARTFDRGLAVLMLRALGDGPRLGSWVPRLNDLLRMVDRAALYATDCVEILLPEATPGQAEAMANRLVAGLTDHELIGCGVASWPQDGATADELVEAARDAVRRATGEHPVQLRRPAGADLPDVDGRGFVVLDPVMAQLHRTIERVAPSVISVLILGETGTGKEVIARRIHERSDRRDGPMRVINCGAIPATLLESTLFGHEKGAFTGADQRRAGVFEEADGGTLLLDEIGELSLQAQVALLRVLETRRIQRVGSTREIEVDVRVVAATHRDLEAMCGDGAFRWDLLYRLNPITLRVPPLRERVAEIPPLVAHFIREANRTNARSVQGIAPDALQQLEAWGWPGNVRELRNTVERAVVIAAGERITLEDLPERVLALPTRQPVSQDWTSTPPLPPRVGERARPPESLDLKARVGERETALIRAALHASGNNRSRAAELLRMPRRTLVYKLRTHDIRDGDPGAVLEPEVDELGEPLDFAARIQRFELALIERALARAGGDRSAAARLLHIQKRTLDAKLSRS